MMRSFLSVMAVVGVCCFAVSANADTLSYSWEDGGTILGYYGNLVDPTNVTGEQTGSSGGGGIYTCPGAYDGDYYLHVAEEPHSGTPQAYVAWITGLMDSDMVYASIRGYDTSPGASPSMRIWAHYATATDIDNYQGSAGEGIGNTGYTAGTGWDEMSSSWEYGVSGSPYADYGSLVIELRLYSSPSTADDHTDYWADLVTVTAPDYATVQFAPEPGSLALLALGGLALLRRR